MSSNFCLETSSFYARVMEKDDKIFVGVWTKPDSHLVQGGTTPPFGFEAPAIIEKNEGTVIFKGPEDTSITCGVVRIETGDTILKAIGPANEWEITEAGALLPFDGSDNFPPRPANLDELLPTKG